MPTQSSDPICSYSPRRRWSLDHDGDITHIVDHKLDRLKLSDVRFRPRFYSSNHGFIGILLEGVLGEERTKSHGHPIKHELHLQSTLNLDDLICLFGKIRIVNPRSAIQEGNRDFLWLLCQSMIPAMRLHLGKPTVLPDVEGSKESPQKSIHDQEVVDVELHIGEFVARGTYQLLLPNGQLDLFVLMLTEDMQRAEARRFKPI